MVRPLVIAGLALTLVEAGAMFGHALMVWWYGPYKTIADRSALDYHHA